LGRYTLRMAEDKKNTSIRLSAEGERLRRLLAKALGVNKTAVIEIALRDLAAKNGVK
jgi:predicted DNA-binding protein